MHFRRDEEKKLWHCVRNRMSCQQAQLHRHRPPPRPMCRNSLSTAALHRNQYSSPPPRYSSKPYGIDYSDSATIQMDDHLVELPQYTARAETDGSMTSLDSSTSCALGQILDMEQRGSFNKSGCKFENCGGDSTLGKYENSNDNEQPVVSLRKRARQSQELLQPNTETATATPTTDTFASVVNIFRHCCGASSQANGSTPIKTTDHANNNNISNYNNINSSNLCDHNLEKGLIPVEDCFKELMRQLKKSQKSELLKILTGLNKLSNSTNCILIKRAQIFGEDPFVITCRLFLWPDLKNVSELKRSPGCSNELESVYVCCNPRHWYRIVQTEPPFDENIRDEENSSIESIGSSFSLPSTKERLSSGLYVQMPESLTTDGEGLRSGSKGWCKIAYWEGSQRVGDCFSAEKSPINVYSEGACNDGLCLKELVEKKSSKPMQEKDTRKKIGLGITLNKEADGVWLYNRSMESIYIYSPSLRESWSRCLKVMPGCCLKAFDSYRAQNPMYSTQISGMQVGPIDIFTMCISFVKGWGCDYKRRDITGCPCWIEVFFTRR